MHRRDLYYLYVAVTQRSDVRDAFLIETKRRETPDA